MFATLTTRHPMIEYYLPTFSRFPLLLLLRSTTEARIQFLGGGVHNNRTHGFRIAYRWRSSRALYLRNLVSEYECGRVFPAGVRPGSPSRDAANWLSSRLSRSTETRRRYGWLRMVFRGARLFRAPIWCTLGGGGTREAGSTVTESLIALYRVGTHQIRQLDRRRAREVLNLCGRESKGANREVSEAKADLWPRSVFILRGPARSGERLRFVGIFEGCTKLWTAGCWLARQLHQLKASTTMDLDISIFLFSV